MSIEKKEDGRKLNGGSRPNSGRKKGEPTDTVSFRVKERLKAPIKIACKQAIKNIYENDANAAQN